MLWLHCRLGRFSSLLPNKVKREAVNAKIAGVTGEHCVMTQSQVSDGWQVLRHLEEELSHLK